MIPSYIKKFASAVCAAVIAASSMSACSFGGNVETEKKESSDEPKKLSVVTTIFPQYDFTKQLAGSLADVTMLIGPGEEAHTYEPTPQDIIKIQNADIFIYAGGESESWVNGILGSFDSSRMEIIDMMTLCDTVEEEFIEGMEGYDSENDENYSEKNDDDSDRKETTDPDEAEFDEHVWTSIDNAQIISQAISDALCKVDEENSSVYRENCEKYLSELSSIKKEIAQTVNGGVRKTVVFGDRFPARYFTDEFGLDYYAAFAGCAEQSEPSAGTVAFLIDKVNQENIPVVFYIELSNGKVADTIAESTNAKTMCFNSCHNISMEQYLNGVTYTDLMRQNCEALKEALY